MKLDQLEQIVGPINRRFLADGFPSDGISNFAEDKYLNNDRHKPKPPPILEDLSYLNPKSSKRCQKTGKMAWDRLDSKKKLERINRLKKIGFSGGKSKKKLIVRNKVQNENDEATQSIDE